MKPVRVIDNFLPEEEYREIHSMMTSDSFPWHFKSTIVTPNETPSPGFFCNVLYDSNCPTNMPVFERLIPIYNRLQIYALLRIKANLNWRLPEPYVQDWHNDIVDMTESAIEHWSVAIYYVNTNNGYTQYMENGITKRIESIENRVVVFPANTAHRGISQTDTQNRIVINFNYQEGDGFWA